MIRICFLSIIACLVASCASVTTSENPSNQNSALDIQLVDVDNTDPMLYQQLLDHPHGFSTTELTEILTSLHFSRQGVIGWDKSRQLFSSSTISMMVPVLQTRFEEASALQKLAFSVPCSPGNTKGDIFMMKGKLHVRVDALNGKPHFDAYPSPFEFASETTLKPNWILRANEHQTYGNHESFFGLKQETQSWIAVELGTTVTEDRPEARLTSFAHRLTKTRDLLGGGHGCG
jgi:hypothetical protein